MQNEKYFYSHCNECEYNHDYKIKITMTWNDKIKMGILIYMLRSLCLQTKKLQLSCSSSDIFFICLTVF